MIKRHGNDDAKKRGEVAKIRAKQGEPLMTARLSIHDDENRWPVTTGHGQEGPTC